MTQKQKLTFKVDGGLEKVSELYAKADNAQALQTYGENPAALLEALSVEPTQQIRVSAGYKKLADEMDNIDFGTWRDTFEGCTDSLQPKALTSLWYAVNGYEPVIHAGGLGDEFNNSMTVSISITVTITMTMTMTMTSTVASGYDRVNEQMNVTGGHAPPKGPQMAHRKDLTYMARHAQTMAEQIGWFS